MLLSYLAFKSAMLGKKCCAETLQGVWNFAGHEASTLLLGPETFLCLKLWHCSIVRVPVRQAHELAFGNDISSMSIFMSTLSKI